MYVTMLSLHCQQCYASTIMLNRNIGSVKLTQNCCAPSQRSIALSNHIRDCIPRAALRLSTLCASWNTRKILLPFMPCMVTEDIVTMLWSQYPPFRPKNYTVSFLAPLFHTRLLRSSHCREDNRSFFRTGISSITFTRLPRCTVDAYILCLPAYCILYDHLNSFNIALKVTFIFILFMSLGRWVVGRNCE